MVFQEYLREKIRATVQRQAGTKDEDCPTNPGLTRYWVVVKRRRTRETCRTTAAQVTGAAHASQVAELMGNAPMSELSGTPSSIPTPEVLNFLQNSAPPAGGNPGGLLAFVVE